MAYLGRSPSQGVRNRYYKTASGGETSISGALTGGTLTFTDGNYVDVNLNGLTLVAGTDYNTSTANTISGLSALTANDVVEIVVYDVFSVFSGNVNSDFSIGGNLSVTGTVDINGGAVDGTTIGAASASTGAFTTISASGNVDFNGDLDVDGTTNLDVVDIDGAVDMATTLAVGGVVTANAGVVVDNITIDGTEIDLSSGNLTLDVAGQIILDADTQGSGNGVLLKDGGTLYGSIFRSGSDLHIKSEASDEDMIFMGNDGGSEITALTFDMSEAGFATFNAGATIPGVINVGSVGASGGTAGTIAFGGVGGSIDGFRIRNTEGNYIELSSVSSGSKVVMSNVGNFLVGKTTSGSFDQGSVELNNTGYVMCQRDDGAALFLSRGGTTSTGAQIALYNGNTQQGTLGNKVNTMYIGSFDTGLIFQGYFDNCVIPFSPDDQNIRDNAIKLGYGSSRFAELFMVNTTINTSDETEKQDIAALTSAEMTAAKSISALFKTYKWKDAVAAKGDAARIHTGVIAQEVQAAMSAAGLDATKYAFWCSDTWWEAKETITKENGEKHTAIVPYQTAEDAPEGATKRTRLGIRYPELLAFINAATEQRLTDIETRLAALESKVS
tara:strand:- start:969 stop:2807 length:1839 start_codon:yes stop_codon:yes gene_type:complete